MKNSQVRNNLNFLDIFGYIGYIWIYWLYEIGYVGYMRNTITKKIGIISPYFFPHVGGVTNHVWNKYIWLTNLGIDVKL